MPSLLLPSELSDEIGKNGKAKIPDKKGSRISNWIYCQFLDASKNDDIQERYVPNLLRRRKLSYPDSKPADVILGLSLQPDAENQEKFNSQTRSENTVVEDFQSLSEELVSNHHKIDTDISQSSNESESRDRMENSSYSNEPCTASMSNHSELQYTTFKSSAGYKKKQADSKVNINKLIARSLPKIAHVEVALRRLIRFL